METSQYSSVDRAANGPVVALLIVTVSPITKLKVAFNKINCYINSLNSCVRLDNVYAMVAQQ